MNSIKPLVVLLVLSFVPTLRAALDVSIAAEIRLGKVAPPRPPEVVIVEEPAPKGPPPWAPAHGFRRNRVYYYYPGTNVYYRPADRMWIYLDGRDWHVGINLPSTIRVDFDRSVSLTMETSKPYEFHDSIRSRYPDNYFVTKVRVKEKAEKPDHRDGGSPGKSRGKGKNKDK